MHKLIVAASVLVIGLGCTTNSDIVSVSFTDEQMERRKRLHISQTFTERKVDERVWSSDHADLMIPPEAFSAVNAYRPIYRVIKEKAEAKGTGWSEEAAAKNAVFSFCEKQQCDYVAAAKRIVRTSNRDGHPFYEVVIKGFPVVLVDVEEIAPTFYEQLPSGELKKLDRPENRFVLMPDHKWAIARLDADGNFDVKSEDVKVGVREQKKSVDRTDLTTVKLNNQADVHIHEVKHGK